MTPGEIKTVFTDVANKEFPEGRAMLLKPLEGDDLCQAFSCEKWRVKFINSGRVDDRYVNVDQPELPATRNEEEFKLAETLSRVVNA